MVYDIFDYDAFAVEVTGGTKSRGLFLGDDSERHDRRCSRCHKVCSGLWDDAPAFFLGWT